MSLGYLRHARIVFLLLFAEALSAQLPWRASGPGSTAAAAFIPAPQQQPPGPKSRKHSPARYQQRSFCPPPHRNRCSVGWAALPTRRVPAALADSAKEEDALGVRTDVTHVGGGGAVEGGEGEDAKTDGVAEAAGDAGDNQAVSEQAEAGPVATTPAAGLENEVTTFAFSPQMTLHKFKTMQDRRVPVEIKYSGGGGFKRYFEEISTLLKKHFPDVLINREIVEVSSTREEEVFEIRIDGKLVCTKRRGKAGVYLQMDTLGQAVRKARQRRRPGAIVYGDEETYQNVKALTAERTADKVSLEEDCKNHPDIFRDRPNLDTTLEI